MMLSTQFWSFNSNSYLPNIACVAGVKRGRGGGGYEGKEGGRKKRRGDWGEKEGNACYNNSILFTSADAGDGKFGLVDQTIEQAC